MLTRPGADRRYRMTYDKAEDHPNGAEFAARHAIGGVSFPRVNTTKVASRSLALLASHAAQSFGVDRAAARPGSSRQPTEFWKVVLEVVEDQRDYAQRFRGAPNF